MSEIEKNDFIEEEEDDENYITLVDENGEDVSFEVLGTLEYKERNYIVLIPFDEEGDNVVILELVPTDDPDFCEFAEVEDDELVVEVFEEFKKNYDGEYNFE